MKRSLNPKTIAAWFSSRPKIILSGIIALYVAIAAGNISRWSIWFDEAFSAYIVRFNLVEIVNFTAQDVHPPLYYWVLKLWTMLFGTTPLALRSLSVVFGVVAIIGVYVLIKRLYRRVDWAIYASLAAAVLPIVTRFSFEARMYTMVFAIVIWATYVLVRATQSSGRRWWIVYGVLIAAGMLTHYFSALAWLGHWVWRRWQLQQGDIKKFFTRGWVLAHIIGVGLFLPWLPIAVIQFATIQSTGFWIPPLSSYTPVDYLSNMSLYLQYGEAIGWWALLFFALVAVGIWSLRRGLGSLMRRDASATRLLVSLALAPPVILMIASIPPLSSSFMDRYIMYAQVVVIILVVLSLVAVAGRTRLKQLSVVVLLIAAVAGTYNVYYYGNYNKNSATSVRVGEVMGAIERQGEFGQPVIAASPWIYYEAAVYDSRNHRVYFLESTARDDYGSLAMLQQRDIGKIKNLEEFASRHEYIWYIDNQPDGDVEPPIKSWERVKSVEGYDPIDNSVRYRASLFKTD